MLPPPQKNVDKPNIWKNTHDETKNDSQNIKNQFSNVRASIFQDINPSKQRLSKNMCMIM